MVFQAPVLMDWRTIAKNIELPLEIMGFPADERRRRAAELLKLVELEAFADRHPWQLSGGMQQRVAIARALSFDPKLLLMDEPFGALDEMTRERMNTELMSIWRRTGTTIVFVTHSIPEAVFLSTRVVVMSARPGRISQVVDIDLPAERSVETRESERYFRARHPGARGAPPVRADRRGPGGHRGRARPRRGPRVTALGRPRLAAGRSASSSSSSSSGRSALLVLGVQSFLIPRPSVIASSAGRRLVDARPRPPVHRDGGRRRAGRRGRRSGPRPGSRPRAGRRAREVLLPVAIGASTIPIIAFAPITLNWFGPESLLPRITIVAVMVFFPVMVNTIRGLTNVDPGALELMSSYAASDRHTLTKLRGPNALPYWFTALQIATTLSVIGAVVGEFFGGPLYALGIYITLADRCTAGTRRPGRRSCWRASSGSSCTSSAVALERFVDPVVHGARNGPMRIARVAYHPGRQGVGRPGGAGRRAGLEEDEEERST